MKSLHERLSRFSWPWQTPRLKLDAAFEIEAQEVTIRRLVREVATLEDRLDKLSQEMFDLREDSARLRTTNDRLALTLSNLTNANDLGHANCPLKGWPTRKERTVAKKAPAPPPMPAGKGKGKKGC